MKTHRGYYGINARERETARRRTYCGQILPAENAPLHDEKPWPEIDCRSCRRGIRPAVLRGEE